MEETDITIYFDLLKISKEILLAAELHDIEILDKLIEERNKQLKFIYPDIVSPAALSPEKTVILHELIELNKQTIALAIHRRQTIADKIKQIKTAKKANDVYNK